MKGRDLLAWNLRRLRTDRAISQEALATESRIDRAWLSDVERTAGNPTVDLLDRLAKALAVPITELFRVPAVGEESPIVLKGGRPLPVKPKARVLAARKK